MATQGERRALVFLAAVALLGAGTRVWRAQHAAVDTSGITRQLEAVDGLAGRRPIKSRKTPAAQPADVSPRQPVDRQPVDLDVAPAAEIEKLPGIGPALAKRIIKDREERGPFGCLGALDRVKGVGPALLARIDSLATFSGVGGALCVSKARPPEELQPR
jgi:competence protein ComEA